MPEYLLELYLSRTDAGSAARRGERARAAAGEMTQRGTPVTCRRSFFVPAEETLFVLFEADSIEAVYDAARLAELPADRVSVAVSQP